MIDEFETDDKTGVARQLGRGALVIGGGYAAYETGMSFSRVISNQAMNKNKSDTPNKISRLRKIRGTTRQNKIATPEYMTQQPTLGELLGFSEDVAREKALKFDTLNLSDLDGMGFQSPGELRAKITELETKLGDQGFAVELQAKKNAAGRVGEVRIKANKGTAKMTFAVNPISSEGTVLMGGNLHNEFAARQVLDLENYLKTGAFDTMDSDIALMQKYIDELDTITGKGVKPSTYHRQIQDTFLFEESFTGSTLNSPVGKMRRYQAVIDPFKELDPKGRMTVMKNITTTQGYMAGGAGAFQKGVFMTPDAILNRVGLGFEKSPTSYQFIRESRFDKSRTPQLDFFMGEDVGVGQFKYTQVDKDSFQSFLQLASESDDFAHLSSGIGELADEEMILSDAVSATISNDLYNAKLDPDLIATPAAKQMLQDIADQVGTDLEGLGEILQSPGGLGSLGPEVAGNIKIDPYKTIREMEAKHDHLYSRIADIKSKEQYGPTLDAYYDSLQSLHEQQDSYRMFLDDGDQASLDLLNMELKDVQNDFKNFKRGNMGLEEYQSGVQSYIEKLKDIRERRSTVRSQGVLAAMGISAENANGVKLPSNQLEQQVLNMSQTPAGDISMSLRSQYDLDIMSKVFAGQKSTIKAKTDVPTLLGAYKHYQQHGVLPSATEAAELANQFKGVDLIGVEKIVKMAGEGMEQRRIPNAVTSYILTKMNNIESMDDIAELEALGVLNDDAGWILDEMSDRDAKKMINTIQEMNPDKSLEELFSGVKMGEGIHTADILLSADTHSSQAGIGKTGTFTERGMFYLEAQGLDKSSENILGRMYRDKDPFDRFDTFLSAKSAEAQVTAEALSDEGRLRGLFDTNLANRREIIENLGGDGMLTVDLGKNIDGVDKVTVFGQDIMDPYVGLQTGSTKGQMTEYDRSVKDLIEATADPGSNPALLATRVKTYQKEHAKVQKSLAEALLKGKVKGSMYGQAVSSLPGMNEAARELGQKMGLGDIEAPLSAMTRADIKKHYGPQGLEQAEAGDLFGFITREPIEGSHSVIPSQIRVAEDFVDAETLEKMSGGTKEGRIWFADSDMMRQSLMIDFDKDTGNAVAVMDEAAKTELKAFMGLGPDGLAGQSEAGKQFYRSAKRMRYLNPKYKATPVDALSVLDDELADILASQKFLEKGSIGTFSNEFRHVHVGLRDQLASGGNYETFYKGEDFAHSFVENIVKAKQQSKEAILKGEALDTLLLLNGEGKFARASIEERALGLQNIFDTLNYGSKESANEARELAATVMKSDMFRKGMAAGMEDTVASQMAEQLTKKGMTTSADDILRAVTYSDVSDLGNLQNVIKAKVRGKNIAPDKVSELMGLFGPESGKVAKTNAFDDGLKLSEEMFSTGAKNFMKYAIAPAAIIGLGATLMSDGPNVLKKSSGAHEASDPPPKNMNMGQTIFAIPESKVDNIRIKGSANANTNLAYLRNGIHSRGGNMQASMRDMRSSLDKYRLEEMIDKGY